MIRRLKLFAAACSLILMSSLATPALSLAAANPQTSDACAGLNSLNGSSSTTCDKSSQSSLQGIIRFVVQTLSWILGIAAVIMVILSGFKYITAAGDSGKITSAKNTLIYALIGLVVAALAQFMVTFVLKSTNDSVTPCPSNAKIVKSDPRCK